MFCFAIPFLSLVLYYATIFGTYDTFTAEFKTPREWMVRASVFFGFPREGGAGGACRPQVFSCDSEWLDL